MPASKLRTGVAAIALSAALAVGGQSIAPPAGPLPDRVTDPRPLVGFSFLPLTQGNPDESLRTLLDNLKPDLVRLPVYWDQVNPTPKSLDFSPVDRFIQIIADHNQRGSAHQTRIVLAVGARNFQYPEVHVPAWFASGQVNDLERLSGLPAYHRYLEATFQRYARQPLLYAWQIENEPLDNVATVRSRYDALPRAMVAAEIRDLRTIDATHPIVVTTYNSAFVVLDRIEASPVAGFYRRFPVSLPKPVGHPFEALAIGNVLGLDVYVEAPWETQEQAAVAQRIAWKQQTLAYWSARAQHTGKQVWVTEMQGTSWQGTTAFTPSQLVASARAYRGTGARVFLFWGVEDWLTSPQWTRAGVAAFGILRSNQTT